jgi:class 3 adenylate cyclase
LSKKLFLLCALFISFSFLRAQHGCLPKDYSWSAISNEGDARRQLSMLYEKAAYHHKLIGNRSLGDSVSNYALVLAEGLGTKEREESLDNYFNHVLLGRNFEKDSLLYSELLKSNLDRDNTLGHYYAARTFYEMNNYERAMAYADQAEEIAEHQDNAQLLGDILLLKGKIAKIYGITSNENGRFYAFKNLLQAKRQFRMSGDKKALGEAFIEIADLFQLVAHYELASEYRDSVRELLDSRDVCDSILLFDFKYQEITGNDDLDIDKIESWISYFDNIGYTYYKQIFLSAYRSKLIRKGKFRELVDLYLTKYATDYNALKASKSELFYRIRAYRLELEGKTDSAEMFWRKAIDEIESGKHLDTNARAINSYIRYAEFLSRNNNHNKAIQVYINAKALNANLNLDYFSLVIAEALFHEYQAIKNYDRAIAQQAEFLNLKRKIDRQTDEEKIEYAIVENEFDNEVMVLEKEKSNAEQQKLIYQSAFILFVLLAGFAFNQYRLTRKEKQRSDQLLLNILPEKTASELRDIGTTTAKRFNNVTILFADIVGFSKIAESSTPGELVKMIDRYFKAFDEISEVYGLEKIKTIGDAYLAVGGLPEDNNATPRDTVKAALSMQRVVSELNNENKNVPVSLRIGINTGDVVAGVVGNKKFQFDIWGDAVNIAARMEQASEPGKVNISKSTYELVKNDFSLTYRGKIEAKNKGALEMYFVTA